MKKRILFLAIYTFKSLDDGYIFADLVKEFRDAGHDVTAVMLGEGLKKSEICSCDGITVVRVASGAVQKTSSVKKVFNLRKLDNRARKMLGKHCKEKFDLAVCMISHCAFYKTARFIKHRDGAFVYNMVKDIFPQNAVDLGMFPAGGLVYKYFRRNEKKYYKISDVLGALSPAAAEILRADNPGKVVEENPNSIIPHTRVLTENERLAVREKYGLPVGRPLFVYGGNLGKAQGADFFLECLLQNERISATDSDISQPYFVVVGDGTEFVRIEQFFDEKKIKNSKLLKRLSAREFEDLCLSADVGLVFLDGRFTVPNYPSRVLTYLNARLPIIFAVDAACDAGRLAETNKFGFNGLSGDTDGFFGNVTKLADRDTGRRMGEAGYQYLLKNYTTKTGYDIIMKHLDGQDK